jgi:MYXO-CTERM domain-containing protein
MTKSPLAAVLSLLLGLVGCSAPSPEASPALGGEPTGTLSAPIVDGVESPPEQNNVIFFWNFSNGPTDYCTGSLVAPNLVMTALHCVSKFENANIDCVPGEPGLQVNGISDPTMMAFFATSTRPGIKTMPSAVGKKVLNPPVLDLCFGDMAFVILDQDITSVPPLPIHFDGPPALGDTLQAVGWGRTADGSTTKVRLQKSLTTKAIGPGAYTPVNQGITYQLDVSQFATDGGPCFGDSGSPAFNAAGAITGIFSMIASHEQPGPDVTLGDICRDAASIYMTPSQFKDFIYASFKQAGHAPWVEGKPRPGPFGQACASDDECDSLICESGTCSQSCDTTPCPTGLDCIDRAGGKVCHDPAANNQPDAGTADGSHDADDASNGNGGTAGATAKQLGESCSLASDCQSQLCVATEATSVCTVSCAQQACPSGWHCVPLATNPICARDEASSAASSGCSVAASSRPSSSGAALGLLLLATLGRRGRRARRS